MPRRIPTLAENGGFLVQAKACATCIYRRDSPLDIRKLEADVADKWVAFTATASATTRNAARAAGAFGTGTKTSSRWARSRSGWVL